MLIFWLQNGYILDPGSTADMGEKQLGSEAALAKLSSNKISEMVIDPGSVKLLHTALHV